MLIKNNWWKMKCPKCGGYMVGTGEKGSEYRIKGNWGVFYKDICRWKNREVNRNGEISRNIQTLSCFRH